MRDSTTNVESGEKSDRPRSCKEYEHHATTQPEASRREHPAMQDDGGSRSPDEGAAGAGMGGGQQLAGGPVWKHEFARPDGIADMIRDGGRLKHPLETLEDIAPGKPVVAVELDR